MTPDSAASATASDPGSWNRYAYTRGDPVNRVDPTGLDDWAALSDYMSGGGSWNPSQGPTICDIYCVMQGSLASIAAWAGVGAEQAVCQAWAAYSSAYQSAWGSNPANCGDSPFQNVQYVDLIPTSIQAVNECFFPNGTSITLGYTVAVTYQVLDQFGRPIRGTSGRSPLSGLSITEAVITTSGPELRAGSTWSYANGSIDSFGRFVDYYAGDPSGTVSTAVQSYVANGYISLNVLGLGSPTKALLNIYSTSFTEVNSTVADHQCGTLKGDPGP